MIGRFFNAAFYSGQTRGFGPTLRHFFKSIYDVTTQPRVSSMYVSSGVAGIIHSMKTLLSGHEIDMRFNTNPIHTKLDMRLNTNPMILHKKSSTVKSKPPPASVAVLKAKQKRSQSKKNNKTKKNQRKEKQEQQQEEVKQEEQHFNKSSKPLREKSKRKKKTEKNDDFEYCYDEDGDVVWEGGVDESTGEECVFHPQTGRRFSIQELDEETGLLKF